MAGICEWEGIEEMVLADLHAVIICNIQQFHSSVFSLKVNPVYILYRSTLCITRAPIEPAYALMVKVLCLESRPNNVCEITNVSCIMYHVTGVRLSPLASLPSFES
jgi:hypothetical protein